VVDEIIQRLGCCVDKYSVAGSIRRGKPLVGDIELVFVPQIVSVPDGLFDNKPVDQADQCIDALLSAGIIDKRINSVGHVSAWGPLNKLAVHVASGIPVDLFATTEENWWTTLVIRTGSRDTNLRLTTGAQRLNRTLHAYGNGVTDRKTGMNLIATSEREVFELCGVPYLEPKDR
jgi:DNA polymerase/3'-5' exonuclease PolX